jgi:hypothetical protein
MTYPTKDLQAFEMAHDKALTRYCKGKGIDLSEIERIVKDWKPQEVRYYHNEKLILIATLEYKLDVKLKFKT